MTNAQIRRILAKSLTETLAVNHLPVSLYDYQREALESTVRWLKRRKAPSRAYISQATGLGKTVEYSTIVRACVGLRVLVIVPTKTLIEQSIRDLVGFVEGTIAHASSLKTISDAGGEELATHWKGRRHDVLVTTDETFKLKFALIKSELDPHVIIWDECHWAYTEKAQSALAAFPEAVVIGLSATPDYLMTTAKSSYIPVVLDNGQTLYGSEDKFARTYFPELLDERTVRWGIQHQFLAPLAWGQLDFKLDLENVPVVEGPGGMDFDQTELQRAMRENWDFIITVIRKLYQSGQYGLAQRYSAAICPGIEQAESIAEELRSVGIAAESYTQRTKDKDRTAILERGQRGELQFLSSVFALREGWNAPNAEVAMMLRPTKSRVLYMQFMGRVLRLCGEKVALVLDPHYQNLRFAPLSAPVLFGTPGQVVYGGDILVGPDIDRKPISPYLLNLVPVLTVEPIEIEYWAGEDGAFEADGERWITRRSWSLAVGLSDRAIASRIGDCRTRQGRASGGQIATFYALSDMLAACDDLLGVKDQAGADGILAVGGKMWGTPALIARTFGISDRAVRDRLVSCPSRRGKDRSGRVTVFYSITDARKACIDLLDNKNQAGEDGTFELEGEKWGTTESLTRILGVSSYSIKRRLASCRSRLGKDVTGRVHVFYAVSDVRTACADVKKYKKKK